MGDLKPAGHIDAVVFDLGNVFIPWSLERLYEKLIADANERAWFLGNVLTRAANYRLDRGELFADVIAEVVEAHPKHRELTRAFETRWEETMGEPDQSMVELLHELASNVRVSGIRVYGLTNFSAETFPIAEARFDWLNQFDGIVVSGRDRMVKPDVEIYELLATRYTIDPGRIWFTDDSQVNVDGARRAGWQAELFTDSGTTRRHLERLGVL